MTLEGALNRKWSFRRLARDPNFVEYPCHLNSCINRGILPTSQSRFVVFVRAEGSQNVR